MWYLIAISLSFSAGFITGALVARKNPTKTDEVVNNVQDIKSKL